MPYRWSSWSFQWSEREIRTGDLDEMPIGDVTPGRVVVVRFAGQHDAVSSLQREQGVAPCGREQPGAVAGQDVQSGTGIARPDLDDGLAQCVQSALEYVRGEHGAV